MRFFLLGWIWTFISLNEIGAALPSSSIAARPSLIAAPSAGSTTLPVLVLLLYLAALAEVSKIVVTAVPGGGVGMTLACCMASRMSKASSNPCAPATCHLRPPYCFREVCSTPLPLLYMIPRLYCTVPLHSLPRRTFDFWNHLTASKWSCFTPSPLR